MGSLKGLFMAFFIIFAIFPSHEAIAAKENATMEVKLKNYLGNQTSVKITATGDYQTSRGEIFIKAGEEMTLNVKSGKLAAYKESKKLGSFALLKIIPVKGDALLSINGRPYHGSFLFTVAGGYIRPINHVHIEDYLRGVVPNEMPALWHPEALKAQAVAARTYATHHQAEMIDDTISYQVYGGADGGRRTNTAIEQTAGMVIKHDGEIIEAFFSSSNGGMTELNSNVWSRGNPLGYLAIKEDAYDPKTKWTITLDKQQIDLSNKDLSKPAEWWTRVEEKDKTIVPNLKAWLKSNGYANRDIKITEIPVLSFTDKKTGGRATKGSIKLKFYARGLVNESGKLKEQKVELTNVPASKIRGMVGREVMKSYLVDHSGSDSSKIDIEGSGYGHGVGLSQFGAKTRAEAGQAYQQILAFYYPNTTIAREYGEASEISEEIPIKNAKSINMKAKHDSVNDKVTITYSLKEAATVSLMIKGDEGKTITTPVNEQSLKKGSYVAVWNVDKVHNGTYAAVASARDGSGMEARETLEFKVSKDTPQPIITDVETMGNYSTEKVNIAFTINENSKVAVEIKNGKGKVVGVLAEREFKKGRQSVNWDFGSISNGMFTVLISAKDGGDAEEAVSTKIPIRKTMGIVAAREIRIKEKADSSSKTSGTLYEDQALTILAQQGEWYKVKKGSQVGFVQKKHVKK
ncbi:SpoIID/LytB domain-containing protein [Peribacillus muralis]|uniref:SpoIID/LytB domain-containing protein n=1 Tax=Peribacillus muralis TaxID=264697 RepID=UPI00070E2D7C|nr:SpoIID/LytB domain-containing protein [Peribacillus muralis]